MLEKDGIAHFGAGSEFGEPDGAEFAVANFVPEMAAEVGIKFPGVSVVRRVIKDRGQQRGGVEFVEENFELFNRRRAAGLDPL